ncbi:MAG: OmpA family protein [Bacteroidetes bacterium]|nr:OmpA family protein [Bacteroidota bacterium]
MCFKVFISTIICILLFLSGNSQNLVANGGFEDVNYCWRFGYDCCPKAWKSVSLSIYNELKGENRTKGAPEISAAHGEGFMSLVVQSHRIDNFRTYAQTQLLCDLHAGKKYRLQMYLHPSETVHWMNVGIYFSNTEIATAECFRLNMEPPLQITKEDIVYVNGEGWLKVEKEYLANGSEKTMIIGNFSPDDPALLEETCINDWREVVIGIDELRFTPLYPVCKICPDHQKMTEALYASTKRHFFQNDSKIREKLDLKMLEKNKFALIDEQYEALFGDSENDTDTITIPGVLFEFDETDLLEKYSGLLDSLVFDIDPNNYRSIEIVGHTDDFGTELYNLDLSLHRAEAVAAYLSEVHQFPSHLLRIEGRGENQPVSINTTPEGRQLNRRVEIILHKENPQTFSPK